MRGCLKGDMFMYSQNVNRKKMCLPIVKNGMKMDILTV